jgi:hypothetical protein
MDCPRSNVSPRRHLQIASWAELILDPSFRLRFLDRALPSTNDAESFGGAQ